MSYNATLKTKTDMEFLNNLQQLSKETFSFFVSIFYKIKREKSIFIMNDAVTKEKGLFIRKRERKWKILLSLFL